MIAAFKYPGAKDTPRYKAIENSVCPLTGEAYQFYRMVRIPPKKRQKERLRRNQ